MVNLVSTRKTFFFIILPLIAIVILNLWIYYAIASDHLLKPYKNDAYLITDRISAEIAAPLQAGKTDEMINIFNNYRNTKEIELVYLILLDGRTIQPGIEKDATFTKPVKDPFIEQASDIDSKVTVVKKDRLVIASPIYINDKVGILRVDYSLDEARKLMSSLLLKLAIVGIIMIILVSGLGYAASVKISKPYQQLHPKVRQYSS